MKIRYRNLRVSDPSIKAELLNAIEQVMDHGMFLLGPELSTLERSVAEFCGRKYAVGVSSGSEALFAALRALGIGPGDEVITTSLSWIATANAIAMTGATPVFVDITEDFLIAPTLIENAISPNTKAILPVHFTGQMCDMDRIREVSERYNLYVLEDGAQAFSATYKGGICGSFGEASCFSMNPMKVFNAYGEAGMVLTDDEDLYEQLKILRYAGTVDRFDCVVPSLNGRLDTIQAAMLLVSLRYLPQKIEARRVIASRYKNCLSKLVRCPEELPGNHHIYYSYTILAERRDELAAFLAENGIETQIQHPLPMPFQTAYRSACDKEFPMADYVSKRLLCLPNQEGLTEVEQEYICNKILEFYS